MSDFQETGSDSQQSSGGTRRWILFFVSALLVGLSGTVIAFTLTWMSLNAAYIDESKSPDTFVVPKGVGLRQVSLLLEQQGLLEYPVLFEGYARYRGVETNIREGEYPIKGAMTPIQLVDLLLSGDVVQHQVTVISGWSLKQLVGALQADERLLDDLPSTDYQSIAGLMGSNYDYPEGLFLPETYFFTRGASVEDILRRSYRDMDEALSEAWSQKDEGLPLKSPYEMLILASIVEKETGLSGERSEVAGVFVNRLRIDMKLQTDPTVIYGMGDRFDGDIRRKDLREDTPYNTYVHKGLPPTPISLPSREALLAVAHPAETEALFFVADGSGGHKFSKTLKEHQAAVKKYILKK